MVAYSSYIVLQVRGLRRLQSDLADRSRKNSLQLLRVQNDLNSLALAMRDMLDASEPYPLTAWWAQFERIRTDLDDALRREEQVAVMLHSPEQREYLRAALNQFWDAARRTFALANNGHEVEARADIRDSLQARQAALSTAVSRLLVQNNEYEEQAAARTEEIYNRVERQVYVFLAATLIAILLTSLKASREQRKAAESLAVSQKQVAEKLVENRGADEKSRNGLRYQLSDIAITTDKIHTLADGNLTALNEKLEEANQKIAILSGGFGPNAEALKSITSKIDELSVQLSVVRERQHDIANFIHEMGGKFELKKIPSSNTPA